MKISLIAAFLALLIVVPAQAETVNGTSHLSLTRVVPDEWGNMDFSQHSCHLAYCVEDADESEWGPTNIRLGVAFTVQNAYNATADLNCHAKETAACLACFNKAARNFRDTVRLMVKNKLLTPIEGQDMRSAIAPFFVELKTGC